MTKNKNNEYIILIVDDNKQNIQVLGSILRDTGFSIEFALNGKEAITLLSTQKYSLILLDIMMPGLDGFETCIEIRKNSAYNNIPIIFLTAKTDRDSMLHGFEVGGQDYVTKPFDKSELMARMNTQLELKTSRDKLNDMNAWLQAEVDKKTIELKRANADLLMLDKAKSDFLSLLSHEIRTPLNGLLGPLKLIQNRNEAKELIDLIKIMELSVARLEKFSLTALIITELQFGHRVLNRTTVNVGELVGFCIVNLNDMVLKNHTEISLEEGLDAVNFQADYDLVMKAMMAIIGNAIKHSGNNGRLSFSVTVSDKTVIINVTDSGPGFPAAFIAYLSQDFNPGILTIEQQVGIDLHLAKLVMDTHEGTLTINNNKGGGATVSLSFNT